MTQQRVLVTGGANGVGAEVVELLRQDGWQTVVADLEEPAGNDVEFHRLDLAAPASIRQLVDDLGSELTGLVSVAGVPGTLDPQLVMAVNFSGLRMLTELCAERTNLSRVAHVSSLSAAAWADNRATLVPLLQTEGFEEAQAYAAELNMTGSEAYVFSKQAVILLTQWQAAGWIKRGIRVNCVSPGPIETRLMGDFRRMLGDGHMDSAISLQGRAATPSDIAPVLAFLMSDRAGWVSGSNLNTDGGLHAAREYAKATSATAAS